ncbi:hypothetical protein SDC9_119433 [bioreactor metagenome]|uniref:Uncharacterized protein n=1 Tax=bioreactor metagenome TaxID=1076179 RepID=A0A645C5I7_9ZZZZ
MLHAQLLGVQHGACSLDAGLAGLRGGGVLLDLLRAECAGLAERACALGVGGGFGGVGLGFQQVGARLGDVGLDGLAGERGQHLARAHRVAHVHAHVGQAQAIAFRADAGFLPGGDVAVGGQLVGDVGGGGVHRCHGEGRARRAGVAVVLAIIGGA